MINLFDSIVQSHRREVAASLKAGAFDEWDVKQVETMSGKNRAFCGVKLIV